MRFYWFISLLFFGHLAIAQVNDDLLRAQGSFVEEDYETAWQLFAKIEADEDWILKRKIHLAWVTGRHREMMQLLEKLDSYSDQGLKLNYQIRYYAAKNSTDTAFDLLGKLLNSRRKPPRAQLRTDEAFSILKKYPQWDSLWKADHYKSYDLKLETAIRELEVKNYDLALTLLDELIEQRPFREMPWYYRSRLLLEQGFTKSALDDADQAIKEDDDQANFYILRAKIYLKLDKPKKALKDIRKAIEADPYQPGFYLIALQAAENATQYEAGLVYSEHYLMAHPEKPQALYYRALMIYQTGSCMKALPHINKAIARSSHNPDFYYLRAQVYQSCKVYRQAEKDYGMCMDFWPRKAELYLGRAICRHHTGDISGSCRDLRKALDLGALEADEKLSDWCR